MTAQRPLAIRDVCPFRLVVTAIVTDMAFVLAERLDRRTHDVVSLLEVAGSRLPISELERLRSRALE